MKRKLFYSLLCSLVCIFLFSTTVNAHEKMPRIFIQIDEEFLLKGNDSSNCKIAPAAGNEHDKDDGYSDSHKQNDSQHRNVPDNKINDFIKDAFLRNIKQGQHIFHFHDHLRPRRSSLK